MPDTDSESMNLRCRRMDYSDLEELYELLSDPLVMEHLEPPFTKERTLRFLESAGLCASPLIYAVEDGGGFIGYVIYHDYDAQSKEIGWVLKRSAWGKGYATALTGQLVRRAKSEGKSAIIECAPEQSISKHIAQKSGFSYTGRCNGCDVYRLD